MIQTEMDESIQAAIDSQRGTGWLMSYCTSDLVGKALTLMVAAKFNWYQTNHHGIGVSCLKKKKLGSSS